jgi:adenine-specific DNA-methyltransferase
MSRHIDKAELISKLQTLEGLTVDERSSLIGLLREHKKYGLVWEDKPEDVEERLRDELPVLREVKDKAILSDEPDAPNHILIEGDNLEALTALSYTHEGKIDVIYIDPPYNTGKKDEFKYNDYWVDSEDSYRHSKWLSFMNKRLNLAKKLLKDDGLIFISIDDNEIGQLKVLCDEIFTHNSNPDNSNSLGVLVWDLGSGTSAGHFTRSHEYVLAYCKRKSLLPNFSGGEGIIDDRAIKKKSIKNAESEYTFKRGTKFEAEDGTEFIGQWGGTEITRLISGRMLCKNGALAEDVTLAACWTQRNQMDSFFEGKETYDTKGQRVKEFYFRDNGKLYCRKERDKINPPSVLRGLATTKQGSSLIKELFDDSEPIGFAKPLNLITFLLSLKQGGITILDFFAGSGTTLHATMQLNAEDGGHRQCILVTNNENKICEEVTYERNKRVINGYTTPKGVEVAGLKANTLRYYKTDYISRDRTQKNMRDLVAAATDLLCIKEDLYDEQRTFGRFKLKPQLARYFNNGKKHMLIVYREELIDEIAEEIKNLDFGKMRLKIYVFSPGRYAFNDNFREVEDKVELVALPAAIYDAYQKVLPKRREKLFETEGKKETTPVSHDLFANEEEGGEA